ncbi:hypothetical protein G7046_g614 [Stylonectria norvegica]|nr:hypothetical protein G7046_g614 [Stylonectria norvegica]
MDSNKKIGAGSNEESKNKNKHSTSQIFLLGLLPRFSKLLMGWIVQFEKHMSTARTRRNIMLQHLETSGATSVGCECLMLPWLHLQPDIGQILRDRSDERGRRAVREVGDDSVPADEVVDESESIIPHIRRFNRTSRSQCNRPSWIFGRLPRTSTSTRSLTMVLSMRRLWRNYRALRDVTSTVRQPNRKVKVHPPELDVWSITPDVELHTKLTVASVTGVELEPPQETGKEAKAGKDSTTMPYQPTKHGPQALSQCPKLPQPDELIPRENAKLCLEAGFVLGDNPGFRAADVMRVLIPMIEHIAPQSRYYVGCPLTPGRLSLQVIKNKNTPPSPEFWDGVNERQPTKLLRHSLNTACCGWLPSNYNTAEHLNSQVALLWNLYKLTGSHTYLRAIEQSFLKTTDNQSYGRATDNIGTAAFMDFDEGLSAVYCLDDVRRKIS